jgi:hypothetical protein
MRALDALASRRKAIVIIHGRTLIFSENCDTLCANAALRVRIMR